MDTEMRESAEKAMRGSEQVKKAGREALEQARARAGEIAERAKAHWGEGMERAKQYGSMAGERASEYARGAHSYTRERITKYPFWSMLTVLGVGLLAGTLLGRSSKH